MEAKEIKKSMMVHFRVFKSSFRRWDELFSDAADFASRLGEQRLINISHACDHGEATVTVWYWDKGIA